jgi:membrane-associated protease RseP (regulator of RpoE activity)
MARKESRGVWDALLIVAVAALAVTFAHAQQATAEEGHEDGRIVGLSADGAVPLEAKADHEATPQDAARPAYWLGIQGAPIDSEVLRTHLQLADDVGVVVADVMPNSPAEKAGLRKHDILLEVGGVQISEMPVLQKAVAESNGKPIELKIIRLAKEMTISVTPEAPPADIAFGGHAAGNLGLGGQAPFDQVQKLLGQLPQGNLRGNVRVFGNGMIPGIQRFDMNQLPDGVSVQVTREGNGPATVTVQKGDETWTVKGDDQEALNKLPEDVRPYVEQMLNGQNGNFEFGNLQNLLPNQLGHFDFQGQGQGLEDANQQLLKQMEQLQRQMDELRQRLDQDLPAAPANPQTDPSKT